ncbi:response regulator NasT [Fontibacillus phaseoli]|uniref:Response regulator NasT n=1 Tax=Fontibacillus phaseoli TaxID=1416533 RepID=A0A369B5F4_9BACL|nr:ANTAR domain-containing protein [Fontibacillus phaseoli]RCX16742.1 response regulator NasT [Fontibacillus phaseoli]
MRFLLVICEQVSPKDTEPVRNGSISDSHSNAEPERMLKCNGYQVFASSLEEEIRQKVREADAVVLQLPIAAIRGWEQLLLKWKAVPLLWWCSAATAASSLESCEDDIAVDGILTPSMSAHELHWALHLGAKHFFERQQWIDERAQLVSRLEERKWIDLAKGVLCEINRISEAEAYDVLRKRAMNERKRIVDIATSIVKAHQQLRT